MGLWGKLFGWGPKSARAYSRRADRCNRKGDFEGAIAYLNEAIRLDPRSAPAYCDRGWNHLEKEMYEEAFADFTKAIELNPAYALAYHNRGVAYAKLHD
jgi:tetratricopeptide (TPR) repeat protein